jgi:hypothetical protein
VIKRSTVSPCVRLLLDGDRDLDTAIKVLRLFWEVLDEDTAELGGHTFDSLLSAGDFNAPV